MATCPASGSGKHSGALASLLSDNPRYAEMFDVNKQSANTGVDMDNRDYTEDDERAARQGRRPEGIAA
jgi:pantothenate kinase